MTYSTGSLSLRWASCTMKITLDHNCIIDLLDGNATGTKIKVLVDSNIHNFYLVDIGASEMREKGVRPDRYDLFNQLLSDAGIAHLPRLSTMFMFDVTFWDRCIWGDKEMIALADRIENILFGDAEPIDIASKGIDSSAGRKWLNRLCDVHTMWCHIRNDNDIFLTSDKNFFKETKLPRLVALGAGRICKPNEL
jgi:hypothetical protein